MQNLKNRSLRIIVGLALLISIFFGLVFLINLIPTKSSYTTISSNPIKFIKLAEFKSYRGYIDAQDNNLNRIDILFKNPNLESRDELIISVTDSEQTIYEQKFTGFNFGDTSRARLDFPTIVNSKDQKYTINIIPTKIVDGKLSVGINNENVDIIYYCDKPSNFKTALLTTLNIVLNPIFVFPLILFILFLW